MIYGEEWVNKRKKAERREYDSLKTAFLLFEYTILLIDLSDRENSFWQRIIIRHDVFRNFIRLRVGS